jgi:lipoyl(octanoyl) transferase
MAVMLERVDLGEVEYDDAMARMAGWVAERRDGVAGDRLFLLSHPPVITYGARTPAGDLPPDLDVRTVATDRGGYATYHGPGQLVGYLVVKVREWGAGDLVRWVENGLIDGLARLGFTTVRRDTPRGGTSLVGVWTPEHHKIASIGMRVRHGVTSHGFALNVAPDMTVFDRFTVCGLHDVTMTSLQRLAERDGRPVPTDAEVRDAVAAYLTRPVASAARPRR